MFLLPESQRPIAKPRSESMGQSQVFKLFLLDLGSQTYSLFVVIPAQYAVGLKTFTVMQITYRICVLPAMLIDNTHRKRSKGFRKGMLTPFDW